MDSESITIREVQAALTACLAAHPPVDQKLHREAARLADLHGVMVFEHQASALLASLEPDLHDLLNKWRGSPSVPTPKSEG